jgi:hypothetical protein
LTSIGKSIKPVVKWYFIYLAVAISLVVLFKPGGDGPLPFTQADKVIHVATFALLAMGLWWRKYSWKVILGSLIIYAVASEAIQRLFIFGREFELLDIVADTIGSCLVLALGLRRKL